MHRPHCSIFLSFCSSGVVFPLLKPSLTSHSVETVSLFMLLMGNSNRQWRAEPSQATQAICKISFASFLDRDSSQSCSYKHFGGSVYDKSLLDFHSINTDTFTLFQMDSIPIPKSGEIILFCKVETAGNACPLCFCASGIPRINSYPFLWQSALIRTSLKTNFPFLYSSSRHTSKFCMRLSISTINRVDCSSRFLHNSAGDATGHINYCTLHTSYAGSFSLLCNEGEVSKMKSKFLICCSGFQLVLPWILNAYFPLQYSQNVPM
ncbi:hypothetical protein Pelo_5867 [Pelomyxa schiedti]|nr:hypothetical protein Pelo_5867 [Pelomyxa schiedti]